jgi:hypothetical protein
MQLEFHRIPCSDNIWFRSRAGAYLWGIAKISIANPGQPIGRSILYSPAPKQAGCLVGGIDDFNVVGNISLAIGSVMVKVGGSKESVICPLISHGRKNKATKTGTSLFILPARYYLFT